VSVIDRLCTGVRPWFSDALDGERLPLHVAVGVRLHLIFCPMCRRTWRSLRSTRDALRELARADQESDRSSKSTKPSDSSGR
jgi:predicted anti-sigma-YlaC factor YlaD